MLGTMVCGQGKADTNISYYVYIYIYIYISTVGSTQRSECAVYDISTIAAIKKLLLRCHWSCI